MATENNKNQTVSPGVDTMEGRTGETDTEEWAETQELLNDPVFMESHARAEKDRAKGVSKKLSEIRKI